MNIKMSQIFGIPIRSEYTITLNSDEYEVLKIALNRALHYGLEPKQAGLGPSHQADIRKMLLALQTVYSK